MSDRKIIRIRKVVTKTGYVHGFDCHITEQFLIPYRQKPKENFVLIVFIETTACLKFT